LYIKGENRKCKLLERKQQLSPFTDLAVEFSRWYALNVDFDDKYTRPFLTAVLEMSFSRNDYMSLDISSRCIQEYTTTFLELESVNKSNRM